MACMTLFIDRRGASLELSGTGVVHVRYPEQESHRVGLNGLRRIILHGDVQVSTGLLRACNEAGVGLVLAPGRGRGEVVHVFPASRGQVPLRLAQHQCYADPQCRLVLARRLVAAKIAQQALWLEAHGVNPTLQRFAEAVDETADLTALMGVEGAASARYFALWGRLWQAPWSFPGRNRRPPQDPINSLLSLGYALARNYIGRLAALRGLDITVGFLHAPQTGRPSLVLDLLEPLRARVDQWVWLSLNNGNLSPDNFTLSPAEGCRLNKAGRAAFYGAWYGSEDDWLQRAARDALALVLKALRRFMPAMDPTG